MNVAVVGAGISGLQTARLLTEHGARVTVLEARTRVGGRLETQRDAGVVYESGGEWIDGDHFRVRSLLSEYGLTPAPKPDLPTIGIIGRERLWPDRLPPQVVADVERFEYMAGELARWLKEPVWDNEELRDTDHKVVQTFVDETCQSELGQWWVTAQTRSDEGDDLDRISLLGWLAGYRNYLEREGDELSAFRFPGGAQTLCEVMAAGDTFGVELGKILRRVTQTADGVLLDFEDELRKFDFVVLTLPPRALERVVFDPALPVANRCALEACGMSRAIKIATVCRSAWWREEGWGGCLIDAPHQQLWESTLGEVPVLNAYICGNAALRWLNLDEPEKAFQLTLEGLFPGAVGQLERTVVHDWIGDPYAQGAFSHFSPGYVLDHLPNIAKPLARVHFAGEHTAKWSGFIEGALESAERVTRELLER